MATQMERLPYGVGRTTPRWYTLVSILLAIVGLGIFAYWREASQGMTVTGLRNVGPMGGATWGLYVSFIIYFVGVSFAGITVAALIRLANLRDLRPVSRMAELLTVIALILAALVIVADLGQPLRGIANLFRYARPQSPFFGTFTLVIAGYLFASVVYLYLSGRRDAAVCAQVPGRLQGFYRFWAAGYSDTPAERERHKRVMFWLALAIVPLLVVAHSTLGFVFGLQVGRPGWFSALQAPAFVVLAGVSGVGLLIVIAAALRRTLGAEERLKLPIFRWLGNFLLVLLVTYIYFMVVELLTAVYAGQQHEVEVTRAMLLEEYAWLFYLSVGLLAVPLGLLALQFFTKRVSIPLLVTSGILVNLGAIGKRYVTVVPSQTHGTLLPYEVGSYSPSWIEYSVILGLVALGALMYVLFTKVFPIMSSPDTGEGGQS